MKIDVHLDTNFPSLRGLAVLILKQIWFIAPRIAPRKRPKLLHFIAATTVVATFWSTIPAVLLYAIDYYIAPPFGFDIPSGILNFFTLVPAYVFGILSIIVILYGEKLNKLAEERRKERAVSKADNNK